MGRENFHNLAHRTKVGVPSEQKTTRRRVNELSAERHMEHHTDWRANKQNAWLSFFKKVEMFFPSSVCVAAH